MVEAISTITVLQNLDHSSTGWAYLLTGLILLVLFIYIVGTIKGWWRKPEFLQKAEDAGFAYLDKKQEKNDKNDQN